MTTLDPTAHRRALPAPDGWTVAGAGLALVCVLVGTYVQTPWKSGSTEWGVEFSGNGGWGGLALLIAFVAVAVVLVGLATARARAVAPERTARRALLLAGLGVVTIVVFWTGLPPVLAAGAAGLAVSTHRRLGRLPASAAGALVLAALIALGAVYLAFTG
ncbi:MULTISPECIES: hypothetical protein [unclassified Modestobacter]|uniref:hypothetical protein n=1 Tax=unclassified Modestobacter TaxID=2643866 RepID=UPI0022AB1AF0|nr:MULTISPECIES: hypothetical protein [unclassified Modestobacter]MCZ2826651.1 hypothetical protein [Modestobacter sp. VKM Ac-2981]MCZ2855031.1 hypothetical protein [Modestobacter sp. VKM Ac-2982]